ncbi:ORF6C domain-containing protein [Turicibacter sanguinis]|uniref:ORF6C domain-containing protein n=1 Tax=Turicibacter sanguinis TaxID=154288 RepID=UPI0018AC6810|nr:ORF6C domain-containing protein [Turicibacter sanguinis]MDB8552872.1 ORF6C domain-containing protein [Turicibacter sanguinis]
MSKFNITSFYSKGYENAELIKVTTNEQGQKLVSGRELYEVLKVQKDFTDWMKNQLENIDAIEGEDFTPLKGKSNGGRPTAEYILTLDTAKEICMVVGVAPRTNEETRQLSKQVRKYFIECEKVAHNPYANLSPELQMLIKLEQGQTVLNQRVEEQKQDIVEFKEEFQNFKEQQYIAQAQCKQISNRVKSLGTKLLGGKKSPAYQDKSLRAQVYSDIYSQIHREFGVKSCADIKCKDYSAVFSVIHHYSLPMHLLNDIDYANSQMSLEI